MIKNQIIKDAFKLTLNKKLKEVPLTWVMKFFVCTELLTDPNLLMLMPLKWLLNNGLLK